VPHVTELVSRSSQQSPSSTDSTSSSRCLVNPFLRFGKGLLWLKSVECAHHDPQARNVRLLFTFRS
jgi:hypothetical protein